MEEKKLYLIPNTLGNQPFHWQFPPINEVIVSSIDLFFVEDFKSGNKLIELINPENKNRDFTLFELNEHSTNEDLFEAMKLLEKHKNVGIMSDCGMPVLADPGARIIAHAHRIGTHVIPLVGPSSIPMALAASGLNGQNFAFHGYLNRNEKTCKSELKQLEKQVKQFNQTQIFIEAPYRNVKLFELILNTLAQEHLLCLASGILTENEWIKTKSIENWKKSPPPNIDRIPCVFLIGQ